MGYSIGDVLPVFNIERFAIHDGEGIRTTVFFQGCPLRCAWCANPESQTVVRKIMFLADKCVGCGACAAHCPRHAIAVVDGKAALDRKACVSCGACAQICLQTALTVSGKNMTGEEILHIVLRDQAYYSRTKGGVTLSGGEALLQGEKLLPLLKALHKEGVHIAVETCGAVPLEQVESVLPFVGQFLFDFKSLNAERFRAFTGGDLAVVLRAFERIAKENPLLLTVRVPVIPGFNFEETELRKIFAYAANLGVKRLDLLPYHTLGLSKYRQLGREYPFSVTQPLRKEDVFPFCEMAKKEYGLNARID